MKKVVIFSAILLTMFNLTFSVLAEDDIDPNDDTLDYEETVVHSDKDVVIDNGIYSYEAAVKKALENNEDLKQIETSIHNTPFQNLPGTSTQIRKIILDEKKTLTLENDKVRGYNGKLTQLGYYVKQAKNTLFYLDNSKKQKIYEIKYKLYSFFNDINILDQKIELSQKKIASFEEQLRIRLLKKELNMVTDIEVLLNEQQISSEKMNLSVLENKRKSTLESINKIMGRYIDAPLKLEGTAGFEEKAFANYDAALASALNNRIDLIKEKNNLELANIKMQVENLFYYEYSETVQIQKREVENQKIVVQAKEKEIEQQIYDLFKNIENAELSYKLTELNLENEKKNYEIAGLKYELGMIVKSDLLGSEIKLADARLSVETSRNDLKKLKILLENACTLAARLN